MHKPSTLDLHAFHRIIASRRKLAFWACAAIILVLSLIPVPESIPGTGWDKNDHVLAFSILAILALRAYGSHVAGIIVGLVFYGALIEILQSLTPYRVGEWSDLLGDFVGIVVGYALVGLFAKIKGSLSGLRYHRP